MGLSGAAPTGLLVKPDIAAVQMGEERPPDTGKPPTPEPPGGEEGDEETQVVVEAAAPKRFHGTATLDATRVGRDAGRIADEVIVHLAGLLGSKVTVTLEVEAEVPSGVPDNVVRIVTENSKTLKFTSQGFEKE